MKKLVAAVLLTCLLLIWLTVSAGARSIDKAIQNPGDRADQVSQFNLTGPYEWVGKVGPRSESASSSSSGSFRRPVGSATSPNNGIGVGESIALTYNDMQYGFPAGRYITHYWNGEYGVSAEAGVHFAYELCTDSVGGFAAAVTQSGYNIYEATNGGDWPRGQDDGCALEENDPNGTGMWVNLDVLNNGTAVLASTSRFYTPVHAELGHVPDNRVYFQEFWSNCTYTASIGTSYIDSAVYRTDWHENVIDNYSVQTEVATQFDGVDEIVHVVMGEQRSFLPPAGDDYVDNANCRIFTHYRKIGNLATSGSWTGGQIIDTILEVYGTNGVTLMPSPYSPHVCISYSNPTAAGRRLDGGNGQFDIDVYYRESPDWGVTWPAKVNVTNFDNASEGSPAHFKGWVESPCLYTSNGDLHVIWTGTPTSANPYFDGYNWNDFDTDVYHWARSSDEIVRVANGSYLNDDWLTGSMNTLHCGFGDEKTGYIAFIWLSECNGNLYCIWNQIHERANRLDWRSATIIPAPGILDDCGYTGDRIGIANWEIMMSVAKIGTSSLWDPARSISNTYTPDCALPGDPNRTGGDCGNEWKPAVEIKALDETGLDLTWPEATIVDLTPSPGTYAGDLFLNLEYIDDQYPGGFIPNSRGHTEFGSLNSEKWVRLACVDPVEASIISAVPRNFTWPRWVKLGQTVNLPVIVKNEGNVTLNVTGIGRPVSASWMTFSENPSTGTPLEVDAGVLNTDTFNVIVNTAGFTQNAWLEAEIWLLSDAANNDSLSIPFRILVADTVEPVYWDTVMTHPDMFSPYVGPAGKCIALAVGNMGELGWGAGSDGRVNLDYTDASASLPVGQRECDTTDGNNRLYLVSASPYVILASASDGSGAVLSQSFNDANQADVTGFDPTPAKGSMTGGLAAGGAYDSSYTGRFVNRDTSIAMERIVYGPRSATPTTDVINFIIVYTKVYSADGQAHNHLTVGNAADWDVPSDNYNHNDGGVAGGFVYLKGTDTIGHDGCASHEGRYATEAFGGGYTSAEFATNPCANSTDHQGSNGVYQTIMVDTSFYLDGTPLIPAQPNPLRWWQTAAAGGLNIDPVPDTGMDLCVYLTYQHDYNLGATDTLHFWTVMTTTPIGGTLTDLTNQVSYAKSWYTETVRGCSAGCCEGRVGDANNEGDYPDEVTLGDIMLLVDVKFISSDCSKLACIAECDVNQDGGANPTCEDHVTLGDIMYLVDFLFITGPENGHLNDCL